MNPPNHCPNCGAQLANDAPESLCPACLVATALAPGDRVEYFGNYELLEELGAGGMGLVWKARQVNLNRPVALKMIRSGTLANDEEVRRFLAEAEAAGQLQHPGVVTIHEVGTHEGQYYFTMDLVRGAHLGAVVDGTPLAPARAARYARLIAEAVHYAHGKGILHRDLKPQNVMVDERDEPRVTDFGLAKRVGAQSDLTLTGTAVGSPSYMSPEQALGHNARVGVTADVYSIGAILYEMLTGRPPFQAASAVETMQQVISAEPAAPRRVNPAVPRDLETICLHCLEKDPARRYASARALAEDCARFLNQEPIRARAVGMFGRTAKWARRHPAVAALSGTVAVLITALAVGATIAAVRVDRERDKAVASAERARDHFARSLFEQARALRQSDIPGRRDRAIGSLQKAALLLGERRSPSAEPRESIISRADLRSEVLAAMLAPEATVVREMTVGAIPGRSALADNGRLAAGVWMENINFERLAKNDLTGLRTGLAFYDLATGRSVMELEALAFAQSKPAFSPDGKLVAIPAPFGDLKPGAIADLFSFPKSEIALYDLATRQPVKKLPWSLLAAFQIMDLELHFSPDSSKLVGSPRGAREMVWWDIAKGTHQSLGKAGASAANFALFTHDSKHIIYSAGDKQIVVQEIGGAGRREIPLPMRVHGSAAVDRYGPLFTLAAIGQSDSAGFITEGARLVYDWQTGERKLHLPLEHPLAKSAAAFSSDGRLAFSDGSDIKIYDLRAGRMTMRIRGTPIGTFDALSWDESRQFLSGLTTDGRAYRWQLQNDLPVQAVRLLQRPWSVFGYSPNNEWFAFTQREGLGLQSRKNGEVRDLNVSAKDGALNALAFDFAFSPDGKKLAALKGGRVSVFETHSGKLLSTHDPEATPSAVAFSPEGHLLMTGVDAGQAAVTDLTSGRELWRGQGKGGIRVQLGEHGFLSSNGAYLLNVPPLGSTKLTRLLELSSGRTVFELPPGVLAQIGKSPIKSYAAVVTVRSDFASAGKPAHGQGAVLPVLPRNLGVAVYRMADGARLYEIPEAIASTFGDEDRLLAIGYGDGRVEIREAAGGKLLLSWNTGLQQVTQLAFAPDASELTVSDMVQPPLKLDLVKFRRLLANLALDW
jgi:WD40 repeat protein